LVNNASDSAARATPEAMPHPSSSDSEIAQAKYAWVE
jgi:hypothetical protein